MIVSIACFTLKLRLSHEKLYSSFHYFNILLVKLRNLDLGGLSNFRLDTN